MEDNHIKSQSLEKEAAAIRSLFPDLKCTSPAGHLYQEVKPLGRMVVNKYNVTHWCLFCGNCLLELPPADGPSTV